MFDALDAALDRALHLGRNPVRDVSQIEAGEIQASGRVHLCSPPKDGGRLVRGGFGAPPSGAAELPCACCKSALISFNCPSIDCSRSAILTICARPGTFMVA